MDGERLYSIPLGNDWFSNESWIIDRDGNEVRNEGRPKYIELTDLATGAPRYQYLSRYEDTGRRDEWGNPEVRTFCSLYDMEGNSSSTGRRRITGPLSASTLSGRTSAA